MVNIGLVDLVCVSSQLEWLPRQNRWLHCVDLFMQGILCIHDNFLKLSCIRTFLWVAHKRSRGTTPATDMVALCAMTW